MPIVTTRTGKVAYCSTGNGPPLLLLHSNGHDHHDFDAIVPVLSRTFRTIAIDWPGFGESGAPSPPSSATAAMMCDVLEDIVDALSLQPAVLIGNSIGGMAAVRLAARRPDRVRALVAVDSAGFTPMGAVARAVCWTQGHDSTRRAFGARFAEHYLKIRNPDVDAILARLRTSREHASTIAVEAALWRSFTALGSDVSTEARAVRCPTLLVWGRRDPVSRPRVEGARAREAMPQARYVELDTGHVPFAEDSRAFLDEVVPFLGALAPLACTDAGENRSSA
jgi:pimeloyl-ACP methyl ester carboxylesterase